MAADLQGLTDKAAANNFKSAVGTLSSPNAAKSAKKTSAAQIDVLLDLYPEVVKETKAYLHWQAITKQITAEEAAGNLKSIRAEREATMPWDVRVATKYRQLYNSAMKREKEFDLTFADVNKMMRRKTCFYTGAKMVNGHEEPDSPFCRTIDRIDPTKGYVKGNVVACSHVANQIKNDLFENPSSSLHTNITFMKKMIGKLENLEWSKIEV